MFGEQTLLDSLEAESFRKQLRDVGLLWSGGPLEKDGRVGTELVDHLAAGAARGAGDAVIIGDGDGTNLDLRAQCGHCGKNRSALGAVRHAIRSIFHVAAGKDFSTR